MNVPKWLNDAVFYQIYPATFCDTNGDGIGDLPGITSKLDYIKSLGVTAIWLNPCFDSPFRDGGYDIRDYYKIASRYGSLDDLKILITETHKRGLKILLDLVVGHTSIENAWFQDAMQGAESKYSNYYIWTDGWGQNTGEYPFIKGLAPRDGFYMVNYFYCQPALNFGFYPPDPKYPWQLPMDHPDVLHLREEVRNIMKYWLDFGCDGFRVDMAPSLVRGKDAAIGIRKLWQEYRTWLENEYPEAVMVSEWSYPPEAIAAGFHVDFMGTFHQQGYLKLFRAEPFRINNGDGKCSATHSFFDQEGKGDASTFFEDLKYNLGAIQNKGFVAVPTGNHDLGRIRGKRSMAEMRAVLAFILLLPGVPFIYNGDEIGMDNVYGLGNKEGAYNRSAVRTPMQWTADVKGGFSTAAIENFYLPLDPSADRPDVESQEHDPESLLNFVRRILSLRHQHDALGASGGFKEIYCVKDKTPAVYERYSDNDSWVIAVNPTGKDCEAVFALPCAEKYTLVEKESDVLLEVIRGAVKLYMKANSFAIFHAVKERKSKTGDLKDRC